MVHASQYSRIGMWFCIAFFIRVYIKLVLQAFKLPDEGELDIKSKKWTKMHLLNLRLHVPIIQTWWKLETEQENMNELVQC